MWSAPLQSWGISLFLGASSGIERGDSNLVGYMGFEFWDPCMVLSQALERTGSAPIPEVPALLRCSFSRLWAMGRASDDSGGIGVRRAGRKVVSKGVRKVPGRTV